MSNEVEIAVIDSLKRQIVEAKRQIEQIRNRNKAKFLEIRRKTDQRKARIVLTTLKLKKQLQDFSTFLEDSRKLWAQDLSNTQEQILKYEDSVREERLGSASQINQIISHLTRLYPRQNGLEDTMEYRNVSSGDITIEQECSTDIVYLSTYLKAVIEGSTLDRFSANDRICMKLLSVAKELNLYLKGNLNVDSLKSTKTAGLGAGTMVKMFSEETQAKVLDSSAFSFSSPEFKDRDIAGKEVSMSSEWQVEGDLVSNNSQSQDENVKWNSISVISPHSLSISQGSESSESAELLMQQQKKICKDEKKVGCLKRIFCCICKSV